MTMDATLYSRQQAAASFDIGPMIGSRYQRIIEDIGRKQAIVETLDNALYAMYQGSWTEQQARASLASIGAASTGEQRSTLLGLFTASASGDAPLMSQIDAQLTNYNEQLYTLAQQAVSLGGVEALANPLVRQYIELGDQISYLDKLGFGGGGGRVFQPAPFQFQTLPNGDILAFNPNNGAVEKVGNYPDAVQKQLEVDRNGNLVSINPFTGESQILQEGFGFPEIDPRVEFEVNTALGLAGLEVQQRGQWVSALGQDMANRIQLGMMTYQEAQTNVNTVVQALNQRRADTELALRFAVPKSSIFRDPVTGQRMTRLPGAEALANILSESTGQRIEGLFELPVGTIDPEASARDVMRAGQFSSPIPGLMRQLESTRQMVSEVLGAPLADAEVARAAAAKIAGG